LGVGSRIILEIGIEVVRQNGTTGKLN
jgi:hypothetical protein